MKVLLQRAHRDCSRQRAQYREDLKRRLTHGVESSRVERLRDVIAIGSASFSGRIRATVAEDADGLAQKRAVRQRVRVEEVRSVVEALRGERTRMTREDGTFWDYAYDPLGQLTNATRHLPASEPLSGYQFGYAYDDI